MNILEVSHLKKYFPVTGGLLKRKVGDLKAVDDVSFTLKQGETLGLVGESGCGKTTLGRTIIRLYDPTAGRVVFNGTDISSLKGQGLRNIRKDIQMIFQDPYESLNSRMTVKSILEEPYIIHGLTKQVSVSKELQRLMDLVGLPAGALNKFPHEFSGGQRQRIGIARALALNPKLIICDEPVSALDVSIQSQILNLLVDLQKEFKLSYLFIAHDLSVVRHISDRVAVMYLGKIVELTDADHIYKNPKHPYTKALLAAIPIPDPALRSELKPLGGEVPSLLKPPPGCSFHTRCPIAQSSCKIKVPEFVEKASNHYVSCDIVS